MRALSAFLILAASGRPHFISILSAVRAHPTLTKSQSDDLTKVQFFQVKRDVPPPRPEAFLTPAILISFILFLLLSGCLLSLLFYGREIRAFLYRKLKRQNSRPQPARTLEPEPAPSSGSGLDGMRNAEVAQLKEKRRAMRPQLFIRLPVSPPSLVLKHHSEPLSPIEIDWERKHVEDIRLEETLPLMPATSQSSSTSGESTGSSSTGSSTAVASEKSALSSPAIISRSMPVLDIRPSPPLEPSLEANDTQDSNVLNDLPELPFHPCNLSKTRTAI
ncbi:hypothetical protein D9615_001075 [Tricholomella constricta]|uniref:Uncharacterized protein n=1 Tax=Tricholomella constricta TaxID=117010 RepID=A0A8H5HLJ7_9AGAR|nr:hypothetical protein D9615_001075 [Tricholomella constricta]